MGAKDRTGAPALVPDPDRLVATIEASFPNPAAMQRTFGFDTQLFQVRAPDRLELALVNQGDQQQLIAARQRAAEEAAAQIHRGTDLSRRWSRRPPSILVAGSSSNGPLLLGPRPSHS